MNDVQPELLKQIVREKIRARRKALGLSQSEVVDRVNAARKLLAKRGQDFPKMHVPYLSDVEKGVRIPTLETIAELADALETTPDWLVAEPEKIPA